ncbi:putative polysaccharide biosynthesis protein [Alkalihalobacterium chitinilyticum]|uniref:Polysaccharide biosynthesis protein n=1 Tax=Alkalihalobacterium chitinilyticum TaxID=2980103 RepID=A0ABT5VKD0_9BACI|nr:polysaccharide biosynthesis protein [Alkalihalobacterium chitinilyticum]MDE5415666.1 polysaccharide biosynthesis protein [Alkalihalobacterium chitinilyticum]
MSDSKLLRGTMILTAATFISKILGLIYIFPFSAIVGQQGLALYAYGYLPYTVILSLATMGVPLAVSKFVAKYNALGDYYTGRRLFRSGMVVMSITGFIAFLMLFFMAPVLATLIIRDPSELQGNSMDDIIFSIRMVSTALIIVPIMSVIRGYFQGFQSMGPTAISQVVEQIVRIIFILSLTFLIVGVYQGGIGLAVGFATFGAFVGALGGLAVLLVYWFKRKELLNRQMSESTIDHQIPLKSMYRELISYALPLSFVGLAIPLYQLIDLFTFNNALIASGVRQEEAEVAFGVFSQSAHKLILIPVALATAFSITLVPTITKSFINGDEDLLRSQITQTYQIILFLTIPAAVGLSILSFPAFGVLFGLGDVEIGGSILRYYAPIAIFFSLFAVSAAILQGMNKQKYAVIGLLVALIVKLLSNYLAIYSLGALGGVLTTYLGYTISIAINVWAIGKFANYNYRFIVKRLILISIFVAIMAFVVVIIKHVLELVFPMTNWTNTLIVLIPSIASGGLAYFFLTVRSHLAGQILGQRFSFLRWKKKRTEAQ